MPRKRQTSGSSDYDISGEIISIRSTLAMEEAIEDFIKHMAPIELKRMDRAEAGRRLLAMGIKAWRAQMQQEQAAAATSAPQATSEEAV